MKRLILAALLMASFAAQSALRTNVTLVWSYPTNELSTNLTFKIYQSPNANTQSTNWTLLTATIGTNTQITVPMVPGNMFFVLTASNYWGESDFSNVASTPVPPRSGTLQIQ